MKRLFTATCKVREIKNRLRQIEQELKEKKPLKGPSKQLQYSKIY